MKEIRSRCQHKKNNTHSINFRESHDLITAPFGEQDIMRVHKAFLTPGIHYFHVLTIESGRFFVEQFLNSLHCYNNVGYLTASYGAKNNEMRDILEEIQEEGFLYEPYFLDEFFIHTFDYDFIWLETTTRLCSMPWYLEFKNKLYEHNIFLHIPVIVLSYEQELG